MTKTLFAALAALTIAAAPALASEQPHDGTISPTYSGGFVGQKSGEAGGGFDASNAAPIYGGGQPVTVTGEAGGGFSRDQAVRLGAQDNAERALSALIAAQQG